MQLPRSVISLRMSMLVAVLMMFGHGSNAFAQSEASKALTISPLSFELNAKPGETVRQRIKLYNPSDEMITISMEVEDFQPAGEEGRVVVESDEDATYSLKKWVNIDSSGVTLNPKEQKYVEFSIVVPQDGEAGGKYGTLLAATGGSGGESTESTITQKVGALILLTVEGEVKEELSVKEIIVASFQEYGPVPITTRFENIGTVHVRPQGFVTVTDMFGNKVADLELPQNNVIPGAIRRAEVTWDKKYAIGKFAATLVGTYGHEKSIANAPVVYFWVFPWKVAVVVLAALLLASLFFYLTRKRWRAAIRVIVKGEKK